MVRCPSVCLSPWTTAPDATAAIFAISCYPGDAMLACTVTKFAAVARPAGYVDRLLHGTQQ